MTGRCISSCEMHWALAPFATLRHCRYSDRERRECESAIVAFEQEKIRAGKALQTDRIRFQASVHWHWEFCMSQHRKCLGSITAAAAYREGFWDRTWSDTCTTYWSYSSVMKEKSKRIAFLFLKGCLVLGRSTDAIGTGKDAISEF